MVNDNEDYRAFFPNGAKCLMNYFVASGHAFAKRRCSKGN